MPRYASASILGWILRVQYQHSCLRSHGLHGMETQSGRQSDAAQVGHVRVGQREGIYHSKGFPEQSGFAPMGK